jgi:hypothetical protein
MRRPGFGTDDAGSAEADKFFISEAEDTAQHGLVVLAEGRGRAS